MGMGIPNTDLKTLLEERWDVIAEMDELLETCRGHVFSRRCWNGTAHRSGDKSPSLSFNPKTGAWKCHACGEMGDIYTLYQKVKGMSFEQAIPHLLAKYKLDHYMPLGE